MKTTFRIARLELSTLFYSPIAWFLLIVFLFQCGLVYTSKIEGFVIMQEMGTNPKFMTFLTRRLFAPSFFGMWPGIMEKLYLYLPLLTMGLMSREISSGTIKLIYSSPIKIREIIFGKFLAMMAYNLLLVIILLILVVAAYFNIQHADIGMLLSGVFGMFLLLCAYSSIGLFMSCLTSYQVVAAISTLVVFAILGYIGSLWQDIDFVRDLTYFLSIDGRAENMLDGLISTKDVLYFLVIVYIFLGLSVFKLQAARESVSRLVKASRYVFVIVTALFIGYVTSRPALVGYLDSTATKSMTLTPNTQKTLAEMGEEPLEVTSYVNLLDGRYWHGSPDQRNKDMARWEPYLRFKPNIKFNYVYFYDSSRDDYMYKSNPGKTLKEIAEKYAKSFKVNLKKYKSPEEMKQIINLFPEENRYVMQLKYKGKTTFLRLFNDLMVFPSETETSAALKRLMVTLPKIAFVEGEFERSANKMGDREYKVLTSQITFRHALVNQGFDVITVNLNTDEVPKDIASLVIADPKTAFTPEVTAKINKYIEDGGNLLISGEPGKQGIINPLIQQFGVQLIDGVIIQKSKDFAPDLVLPYMTKVAAAFSPSVTRIYEDSVKIAMPGTVGLKYETNGAFDIKPLTMTDDTLTWIKRGKLVLDSADIQFSPLTGDVKEAIPTSLALSRKIKGKEQRIVIIGDADLMNNAELGRYNVKTANYAFNTGIFGWFTYGQFPIDTTRPRSKDNKIILTGDGLTLLKILLLGILPGILLVTGSILLVRRKKK